MTQIDEYQARITRALERIAKGVDMWDPSPTAAPVTLPVEETAPADVMDSAAEEMTVAPIAAAPEEGVDAEEMARLREALEDERLANAQLEERLRGLRAQLESGGAGEDSAALQEQLEAQRESLGRLDAELQRMRQANEALRRSNEALREANAKGVGEPHLINKAMLAELEAIRAARAAEAAETKLVMDVLDPLLAQASGATGEARE